MGLQAETLARTLGDELTEQLPSKADFQALDAKVEAKIDVLGTKVDGLSADFGTLKETVGTLQADVGTMKTDVGTLQADVGTLKTDVGTLQAAFQVLDAKFDSLRFTLNLVLVGVGVLVATGLIEPLSTLLSRWGGGG